MNFFNELEVFNRQEVLDLIFKSLTSNLRIMRNLIIDFLNNITNFTPKTHLNQLSFIHYDDNFWHFVSMITDFNLFKNE
jgi:hypothetical protein